MSVNPDTLADPQLIRNLLANAQRAGRDDLVLECQVRLAKLEGARHPTSLERDFWSALAFAEELASLKNGKRTRLSRTRQKVARVGIRQCLEDWAFHKGTTQGFDILIDNDHPELTGEAIVVRHANEFPPEVVEAAHKRLRERGINPSKV